MIKYSELSIIKLFLLILFSWNGVYNNVIGSQI